MSFNRRRFLNGTMAAAVAWAAQPLRGLVGRPRPDIDGAPDTATRSPNKSLISFQRSVFDHLVGSAFSVRSTAGSDLTLFLTLLSVGDLPAVAPDNVGIMAVPPKRPITGSGTTGFMLSFTGPSSQMLEQGTYVFEHVSGGTINMFIVPSGVGQYMAVVTQLPVSAASPLPLRVPGAVGQQALPASIGAGPTQEPVELPVRNLLKSQRMK
jgi:hypothetical protein